MTADPPQAISRPRVGPGRPDWDPRLSTGRLRGRLHHASGIHHPHVCKCLHVFLPQIFHEHTWAQAPCCKSLAVLPTSLSHTYSGPQLKSDAPATGSRGARASLPRSCEPPALPGGESLGGCTPVHTHSTTLSTRRALGKDWSAGSINTHPLCLWSCDPGTSSGYKRRSPFSSKSRFPAAFLHESAFRWSTDCGPLHWLGVYLKIPKKRLRVVNSNPNS